MEEQNQQKNIPVCKHENCYNQVLPVMGEDAWFSMCEKCYAEENGDEDFDGNCGDCGVCLDHYRDGTTEEGHRCNNCYWEDNDKRYIIHPDYRPDFRWEDVKKVVKVVVNGKAELRVVSGDF